MPASTPRSTSPPTPSSTTTTVSSWNTPAPSPTIPTPSPRHWPRGEGGRAVLSERVVRRDGGRYAMPVLVILFGRVERVAWGMDREPAQLREVGETLAFLKQPEPPGGWREALELLPLLRTVMAMKPKTVGSAPCQEGVLTGREIDLAALPIQGGWPGEPA